MTVSKYAPYKWSFDLPFKIIAFEELKAYIRLAGIHLFLEAFVGRISKLYEHLKMNTYSGAITNCEAEHLLRCSLKMVGAEHLYQCHH